MKEYISQAERERHCWRFVALHSLSQLHAFARSAACFCEWGYYVSAFCITELIRIYPVIHQLLNCELTEDSWVKTQDQSPFPPPSTQLPSVTHMCSLLLLLLLSSLSLSLPLVNKCGNIFMTLPVYLSYCGKRHCNSIVCITELSCESNNSSDLSITII